MISHESLLTEAVQILRQEIPEHLEWLPWSELPVLRWRDGGVADARIPRALLVAAAERGVPEPDAGLRARVALFDRGGAAALGGWVLRAWIGYDTAEPELTDARRAELRVMAEHAAELARRFGRGGSDPDERYRQLLAQESNRPSESALPYQGLLAVAAAAGGAVVPEVERYLAAYDSARPRRCQALRRMLRGVHGC